MSEVHVDKSETPLGRRAPGMFYAVHGVLWRIAGLWADAWELRYAGWPCCRCQPWDSYAFTGGSQSWETPFYPCFLSLFRS
jgi:hypothetical protein